MEQRKQKIFIGLLALALVPAVIFFILMIGKVANVGRPEKPQLQATEATAPVTEETAPPEETTAPPETTVPEETAVSEETTAPPETTVPEATAPEESLPGETEPATQTGPMVPTSFETIPQYFQKDYAHVRYERTNMAFSGSGVVSLAMVASYMTEHAYMPDEVMEFFDHYIGSSMQWLEYASTQLQLPWTKADNVHKALEAVRDGKIVIALMTSGSRFSSGGYHYIVLTGVNEAGKITVLDPDANNLTRWGLAEGFRDGFEDKQLVPGFGGGWIYDPEEMPEEPFIYTLPEPAEFRYPGVELSEWEMNLLAKVIYLEAQGEPYEGQQAIAEVVLNRLVSEDFQNTIDGIIFAKDQFACVDILDKARPTHVQYEAIERALYGPYILPKNVVFYATFHVNDMVWGDIGNHTFCYAFE